VPGAQQVKGGGVAGKGESKAAIGARHDGVHRSLGVPCHPVEHDARAPNRYRVAPGWAHDDS
jgi:hypothetical protein